MLEWHSVGPGLKWFSGGNEYTEPVACRGAGSEQGGVQGLAGGGGRAWPQPLLVSLVGLMILCYRRHAPGLSFAR